LFDNNHKVRADLHSLSRDDLNIYIVYSRHINFDIRLWARQGFLRRLLIKTFITHNL